MTDLEKVKKDAFALQYVKNQTPELCLLAVKQNGIVVHYVKEQTPEICLLAVQQTGYAIEYIRNQTPELCLLAAKQAGYLYVVEFVQERFKFLCKKEFEDLSLDEIKTLVPEMFL